MTRPWEVWAGVDTHKDVNVAAAVDEAGRTIGDGAPASIGVPTTPAGNTELLTWARSLGETVVAFAVEGTGSYGASLTRFLQAKGQYVVEATRPKRDDAAVRRSRGKSDAIDVLLAAQRLHRLELQISPNPGLSRRFVIEPFPVAAAGPVGEDTPTVAR